jgi:hypothetical protein
LGDEYDRSIFYTYENDIMRLTQNCFKKEVGGERRVKK